MTKRLAGIDQITPVATANLNQQVYSNLRSAIMAGKFRPGETLTLRGLAAQLGTSMMPARDAVLRLCVERALESSGRGVRIPGLTLQGLEDVLRFRIFLEGEAAALAAERATPEDIQRIEQAEQRVQKARDLGRMQKFLATNQEFHFAIYRSAHSDLLQAMIETLWLQMGPHLALLLESSGGIDDGAVDLKAHGWLVAAIKRRDSKAARAALQADLKESTDIFRPFVKPPASVEKRLTANASR
jgi:DNA-binding GntR family transcriptional regulator